jgi:Uma2 family endonuclease
MATATIQLGPEDHGRAMTRQEFESAIGQDGYRYELIHGRVVVSPSPNMPHGRVLAWIHPRLLAYTERHPEVINFVSTAGRVFVPDPDEATNPEPDLIAYRDVPLDVEPNELNWEEYDPILVVEILSPGNPEKDLERNVELYRQVPSIREYWIIDALKTGLRPTLRAYRRRGQRWLKPIDVAGGGTYTTRLLPDFQLIMDIRR